MGSTIARVAVGAMVAIFSSVGAVRAQNLEVKPAALEASVTGDGVAVPRTPVLSREVERTLPNEPQAQDASSSNTPSGNQQPSPIAGPGGQTPAILAPWITLAPLTAHEKFTLYWRQAFNPIQVLGPALPAGYRMINPPNHYPHEWKAGGDGFGRLYGDGVARNESQKAGQFLTGVLVHEDPRYVPADTKKVPGRVVHALAFTLVDKSDSKHNMPALSNFAGAAASGFVGTGYLPDGFRDATHAGQRSLTTMAGYAGLNVANEFCPQWAPLVTKLHVPFVHPSCAN